MDDFKTNIANPHAWLRGLYMLILALFFYVAIWILPFLVLIQFVASVVTGSDIRSLRQACNVGSQYLKQIIDYWTYNSEEKPFPFSDLPQAEDDSVVATYSSADEESDKSESDESEEEQKPAS